MNLTDKVVLITGASSGIGLSLAKEIASQPCKIALIARSKNKIEILAKSLERKGCTTLPVPCDVTKKDEVEKAIKTIHGELGNIYLAILNSGVSYRSSINYYSSIKAEETFNVNVMGLVNFVEALLPGFKERKSGIIAGVSSLADGRGFPKSGFYCASKAAASILLESLRLELKPYNVNVVTIKPGFVKTPMTDKNEFKMPFLMSPDEAAKIIVNGIKKGKRIIQFPLPTVLGAKLLRLIPDFLFERIAQKT